MSDCPHATKDGFHWCALGPRGRPTVACSMWRAGGSQNWQHGWGDCPRVLRRVVGLLVEALRYARDYVPVSARAQTMEPTALPSTYYIYGRKPLHPVITAALAAAAALELETGPKGGEEDGEGGSG